jgi:parallel beta-helix repeat protein
MRKSLWTKGFVIGLLLVFVETSLTPCLGNVIKQTSTGETSAVHDAPQQVPVLPSTHDSVVYPQTQSDNIGQSPNEERFQIQIRGETLYVDDDAVYPGSGTIASPYRYIWQGIENATTGDTVYVFNGTYFENVVIDKAISVIGEKRDATIVNGSDTGSAFHLTANNVFLGHFTIENYDAIGILIASKYNQILDCICVRMGWIYGIWVTDSNNKITNCTCLNSYIGIYVCSDSNQITNCTCSFNRVAGIQIDTGCKYNQVIHSTCTQNKAYGLYLYQHANYNQIEGCTLTNNLVMGLQIERSCSNTFRNNSIANNTYNFAVSSYSVIAEYTQDIDPSNTINGKPIYYLVAQEDITLDGSILDIGYVALVSCRSVTVRNIQVERNMIGILVVNTSDSSIIDSSFTDNQANGVLLLYSSGNYLTGCTCSYNPGQGILASMSSTNNLVSGCTCSYNKNDGIYMSDGGNHVLSTTCMDNEFIGIHIVGSPCLIQDCTSSGNHQYGLNIYNAPSAQITNCVVRNNRGSGISLSTSPDSTITSCDCTGNLNKGIEISDSSNCVIEDCNCSGNQVRGIEISWFSPVQITGCTCSENQGDGIYLDYQSSVSLITNCVCAHNQGNGISSEYNTISSCTITDNQQNGITGSSNQISDCWIGYNQQNGITGHWNVISLCTIVENQLCGIIGSYMIQECTITGNHQHGIFINDGTTGQISDCTIADNDEIGVSIDSSTAYQMTSCTISNNQYGLYINKSANNVIRTCALWGNTYGFTIDGTDVSQFIQDIDPTNTVNGKPIFYLVSQDGAIIDGNVIDTGFIALIQCTNCVLRNIHIENSSQGALIILSSYSTIVNCSFSNNLLHGIYLAGSEHNQIINCTCSGNHGHGIYLYYSANNQLTNCSCTDNYHTGINLSYSASNTLVHCVSTYNVDYGIRLDISSDSAVLSDNLCSYNTFGLIIYGSAYCTLRNNTIVNNTYNFGLYPAKAEDINQDIDISNTVNGKPIYFLVGQNDLLFDGDLTPVGYLVLVQCNNITMRNLSITNNIEGLCLVQSNHCTMENLNCSFNYYDGMYILLYSENNTIENCTCSYNQRHGINLWIVANTNLITYCNCSYNQGNGILLDALWGGGCNYNLITHCTCLHNQQSGIYTVESKNNVITRCTCSYNQESGITLTWMSWDNTVNHCQCLYNQYCGVDLQWMSTTYLDNCTCSYNRYGISTHGADTQLRDSLFTYNEIGIRPTTGESGEYIINCTIMYNTKYGISGHQIRNHLISHCKISYNQGDGIYFEYYSTGNQIDDCIISHNLNTGINISDQSDTHQITNCTIAENHNGISLSQVLSFTLKNNAILNTFGYSFFIDGSETTYFRHDIDTTNTIDGKKIVYLVDANNQTVNGPIGYLTLISCQNITAQNAEVPGVLLMDTADSTLSNIESHDSANGIGIYLWNSFHNEIIASESYHNYRYGVYLRSSSNTIMKDTSISNNTVDFTVTGDVIGEFIHTIDQSNTINGNPIYYLIGESDQTIDETNNAGYLSLISCQNITAQHLDLPGLLLANTTDSTITHIQSHGTGKGIYLWDSSHNTIADSEVYDNAEQGILLRNSPYNTLENCSSYDNAGDGVQLVEGSSYNHFTRCAVYGNAGLFGGMNIEFSPDNTLENCAVHDNTGLIAIRCSASQRVNLMNCTIYNSSWYGIYYYTWTDGPDDSAVVNCTVYNISYYGIYFIVTDESLIKNCTVRNTSNGIYICFASNNNKIYYNRLINNTENGYDECTNQWDDGDSKGNYWSDYTGVDRDNDGIGDTPYLIPGGFSQDRYPIMPPDAPPTTPNTPFPWDGATKVSIDIDLTWGGGDPDVGDTATYDVYFGTTSPPPQVTTNQTTPSYDPGDLSLNTTYYWMVLSWDNHGLSSPGSVWRFTTELMNEPPAPPTSPQPSDGALNVSVTAHLSWTANDPNLGDTMTFDVYFGTINPPPKIVSNHSTASYNPGTMSPGTTYYWRIIAWDNHGASTQGALWSFTTQLDTTPPVTTITLDGTLGGEGWYTSDVLITLHASDDLSGVNATYYRINTGAWIVYLGFFTLTSDGTYTIDFYSDDQKGNVEPPHTASLRIDQTPPTTTSELDPSSPNGGNGWYISPVTVTLSATDGWSGVGSTWYKIDTGSWQLYTVPFTVSESGEYTIQYFSYDRAGNMEDAQPLAVNIDMIPPETSPKFSGLLGEDGWFVTNVTVTLSADDGLSGVNYTEYKLDAGPWIIYSGPFIVTENGNHTVYYYSVDLAGVIEQTTEASLRIDHDTKPPTTTHAFAGIQGNNDWFMSQVTVTLTAIDRSPSGINHTYYQLDDDAVWIEYTRPFVVADDGSHVLHYYSVDMVGNEEDVNDVPLKIDATPPTIDLDLTPLGVILRTKWLFNATVSDATSGVVRVDFYVDDVYVGNATGYPWTFNYHGTGRVALALAYDAAGNSAMSQRVNEYTFDGYNSGMNTQMNTQTVLHEFRMNE